MSKYKIVSNDKVDMPKGTIIDIDDDVKAYRWIKAGWVEAYTPKPKPKKQTAKGDD